MEGLPSRDGADADAGSAAAANVTAGSGIPPSPGSWSGSGGTILAACSGCGDALSEEECRRATELGRRAPLCRICDAERFVERRLYALTVRGLPRFTTATCPPHSWYHMPYMVRWYTCRAQSYMYTHRERV